MENKDNVLIRCLFTAKRCDVIEIALAVGQLSVNVGSHIFSTKHPETACSQLCIYLEPFQVWYPSSEIFIQEKLQLVFKGPNSPSSAVQAQSSAVKDHDFYGTNLPFFG